MLLGPYPGHGYCWVDILGASASVGRFLNSWLTVSAALTLSIANERVRSLIQSSSFCVVSFT